jgi:hypothetical protein
MPHRAFISAEFPLITENFILLISSSTAAFLLGMAPTPTGSSIIGISSNDTSFVDA